MPLGSSGFNSSPFRSIHSKHPSTINENAEEQVVNDVGDGEPALIVEALGVPGVEEGEDEVQQGGGCGVKRKLMEMRRSSVKLSEGAQQSSVEFGKDAVETRRSLVELGGGAQRSSVERARVARRRRAEEGDELSPREQFQGLPRVLVLILIAGIVVAVAVAVVRRRGRVVGDREVQSLARGLVVGGSRTASKECAHEGRREQIDGGARGSDDGLDLALRSILTWRGFDWVVDPSCRVSSLGEDRSSSQSAFGMDHLEVRTTWRSADGPGLGCTWSSLPTLGLKGELLANPRASLQIG
uniref:Uncharacterized protein n=1 Tax=Ananas comosus var. bracteatus TaxID=296719 RepID=A0A6V7PPW7_ANACO|nr:unnamed protein product [Ananas comosus var. bracteatus]